MSKRKGKSFLFLYLAVSDSLIINTHSPLSYNATLCSIITTERPPTNIELDGLIAFSYSNPNSLSFVFQTHNGCGVLWPLVSCEEKATVNVSMVI